MPNSKEDDRTKKAVDKSPVHATILPTMDMTKKSEAKIERNGAEKASAITVICQLRQQPFRRKIQKQRNCKERC